MARFFTKEHVLAMGKIGFAVVAFNLLISACYVSASAAPIKTTITKLSLTEKGQPRVKVLAVGTSYVIIAPPRSDGDPVIQKKGTKTYTLPTIKAGKKVSWAITVIGVKNGKVKALKTFTWKRPMPELMSQVVYASAKGSGVKNANLKCSKGTNRIRVWTLSAGKGGSIVDPGVLTVRMASGKDVFIDDPSRVGKTWEFYQFNNGALATKNWSLDYAFPVTTTEISQPILALTLSDCTEK